MKQIFITLTVAILLNSCSSTKFNLGEYKSIPLKKAEVLPPTKKMTLVIFNLDDSVYKISQEAKFGFSIAEELKSKLTQTKQVEVRRRDAILTEERIRDKEGFNSAQYLLMGKITGAEYRQRFNPEERNLDGSYSDSDVSYKACIKGVINLMKLPKMIIRESFDFYQCSKIVKNAIFPPRNKKKNPALLRKNIVKILDEIVPKMQKYFRPQGYVREILKKGDKTILDTTLSSNLGAIEGREVEILRLTKHHDEIANKDYTTERKIGEGEITSNITEEGSFIMIDSLSENPKYGDIVRVSK